MTDTMNLPPAGPPPPPPSRTFVNFDANKGVFKFTRTQGGPEETTLYVTGYARRLWLEWDPGRQAAAEKDSVPARWELNIEIESPELGMAKVSIGPAGTVYVLGSQLLQIQKNAFIGITLQPGDNSTLTQLAVWDGQVWSHVFTPKSDGRSVMERYESVLEGLVHHPLWDKPAPRRQGIVEPALPGQPAAAPGGPPPPAPRVDVQPDGAGPLQPAAPTQAQVTQAGMAAQAPASTGIPAELPLIQGVRLPRAPLASHWEEPASEPQKAAVQKKAFERHIPQADLPWLLQNVANVLGKEGSAYDQRRATYGVLYDFLNAAPDETIHEFRIASLRACDPFWEE